MGLVTSLLLPLYSLSSPVISASSHAISPKQGHTYPCLSKESKLSLVKKKKVLGKNWTIEEEKRETITSYFSLVPTCLVSWASAYFHAWFISWDWIGTQKNWFPPYFSVYFGRNDNVHFHCINRSINIILLHLHKL